MRAAGVNPMDWRVRDGAPAQFDQTARFPLILGLEGAGVIDSVGMGVDRYQPGEAVFGLFWLQVFEYGTFADYLVVPADARMARKPADLSFERAAALPLAGGAAMVVSEWIDLQPGENNPRRRRHRRRRLIHRPAGQSARSESPRNGGKG